MVFPDVADSYDNCADLRCCFTPSSDLLEADSPFSSTGDRVGIYRVPQIAPSEHVASRPVNMGEREVVFPAAELPGEDDFYQYQYLRGKDSVVLGASIPFRLKSGNSPQRENAENEAREQKEQQEEDASSLSTLSRRDSCNSSSLDFVVADGASSGGEDNGEEGSFAVVKSKAAVAADKYRSKCDKLERQYSALLEASEKLSEDLQVRVEGKEQQH